MLNNENEVTLKDLQAKADAIIGRLNAQLEQRRNQIILGAVALITAATIGYWLGRRHK